MKKLLSSLFIALLLSNQAFAMVDTMEEEPIEYIETEFVSYYEPFYNVELSISINNDNQSETSKALTNFAELAIQSNSDINEKEEEIAQAFLNLFTDTEVNIKSYGFFAIAKVEVTEDEYSELVALIESKTILQETNSFKKILFSDFEFVYSNGSLYILPTEHLMTVEDLEDIEFPELKASEVANIDMTIVSYETEETLSSNISIVENDDKSLSINSSTDLDGLNISNNSNLLSKVIPAQNPMLYVEFSQLLDMMSIQGAFGQEIIAEEINSEFDMDLDVASLLNKPMAILVDNGDSMIPYVTLAIDIESTEDSQMISQAIKDMLTDEEIEFEYINENLSKVVTEFENESIEVLFGKLDNQYFISNNPNLIADLGNSSKAIANNSNFANSLAAKSSALSTSYISFNEVNNYLTNNFADLQDDEDFADMQEILKSMNIWSSYSEVNNSKVQESAKINIPFATITDLLANEIEYESENPYMYNPFSDIEEGSWYKDAAVKAYQLDIYDGEWSDQDEFVFNPSKEISRGEFTDMIIRAYYPDLWLEETFEEANSFSDLTIENPYWYSILLANNLGIVQGDDNADTFRPEDTLNRAEAVEILYNVSALLSLEEYNEGDIKFKDVSPNAWYAPAVTRASNSMIVQGINPEEFAPGMQLNKAQAVTLLIRLLEAEVIINL